ncbi:MAG: GNAT family N-acetyltransferase [Planctomycetes bacterium]|nr:GNAT family N-acetyltransferase [Planctomycetota bacterium]
MIDRAQGTLLKLAGGSMVPSLLPGDDLLIVPLMREPRPGEIVVRRGADPGSMIAHRVVRRDGVHWVTQGDRSPMPDPPCPTSEIVGFVAATRRDGTWMRDRLATPPRFAGLRRLRGRLWRAERAVRDFFRMWCTILLHSRFYAVSVAPWLRPHVTIRSTGDRCAWIGHPYTRATAQEQVRTASVTEIQGWIGQHPAGHVHLIEREPGSFELWDLNVRAIFQGLGIARLLLTAALHMARRRGARHIRSGFLVYRRVPLAMYRSLGLHPAGRPARNGFVPLQWIDPHQT